MTPRLSSLAHVGASVLRAHAQRLTWPLKINLCLTYWCQYRCKTCNIWQRKPVDELSTDELLKFVSKASRTSWLDVTGGEIFLRPDVGEILLAIVRQWKRLAMLHFPTNGFLTDRIVSVTRQVAAERAVPIIVTVSLDGDEPLNDEIRGIKGGYRRQIDTFNALRRIAGVRAVLGVTLSRYNVGRLSRIFDACREDCPGLSIEDFHVNLAQTSSHYYGNHTGSSVRGSRQGVREDLRWYVNARGRAKSPEAFVENRYLKLLDSFLATGTTPVPCHALRSSCFIDPWGTVFPCITFDHPIGRLRETDMDLAPIWTGTTAAEAAGRIWKGQCPQCWTACEAYQSILGNLLAPWRRSHDRDVRPHEVEGIV
jgi:radical SAM protein with 4Fe4S-binding SPASM domain